MDAETPPRAMGYVCADLVKTMHTLEFPMRAVARRLGYNFIGITKSSSLVVMAALLDHVQAHCVELLVVPDLGHLRGRVPPQLAEITDIHDLATGRTHERRGGYAPVDVKLTNPLAGTDTAAAASYSPNGESEPYGTGMVGGHECDAQPQHWPLEQRS
ncbi:hypothetical protein B7C42_07454 [Nocardia cerradoensis]|uniref:Uncharacterized protein n=1 Tax=Nocardia cerradoensis TaxID=85688 RepID=A0A231GVE0_9NOCA|nr:hypothetical protein [Nocardia cerradoensis]OXR40515.1 hypothetical protein B7C42_07454 [Nocardia cerradoensis]